MKGSKMKKMKKRILAALLCTTMMLNTGMSAMADGGTAVSSESAHVHTEECYEKSKTDNLICTKAEAAEGHVHGDECYEVTSNQELTCTQAETAGHTHDDSCMETTKNLTCGTEEHTHGGDCYETETKDVCSDESEEHTCGDSCVETEEVLTCTAEEHTHDDGCYESETNIVCGQDEVEAHTHGEGCYTTAENKVLKCTLEEVEAHTHNDDCYAWEEKLVCTLPETAPAAEQPEKEEKAEEAEEAAEVNLQNDDETGIKVSVKSTSDVIPKDTKVVVAPMEIDEEHETALAEAVSEFEVLGYTAYDISLKDAEDEDITLGENKVEVTIDFEELIPEGINAEEVKDVVLVHITTDEEEKLTAKAVGTVKITEEKATVEFEADSFSPYVVTYLSETEEAVEEVVVGEPVVEDVVLTYTSEDEAYTASVTAAPEVLENVTAFEAVPVTDEEKITALTEQLTAKAAEAQKTSLGFENYEFKFLDAEGNEVSVNGEVKVSLSFAEERIPEAATAENVDAVDAALLKTGTDDKGEAVLEEINGLVSAEAGAVKEVVYTTEAPEELILAWSGDVYRTLPNYEDEEVVITLAGTEYALQNVVGFNVTPIKEDNEETKEQYAEVAQQLEEKIAEENEAKEEEKEVVGFLAYDITLVDAEGNELEPQGGVRVSMEYKEAAAPEAVAETPEAEVTIHHFEEDEVGEVKQIVDMVAEETIEATVEVTEAVEVEKVEFKTESFSVFTITWTGNQGRKATINVHYVDREGNELDGSQKQNVTLTNNALDLTTYAKNITGYTYVRIDLDEIGNKEEFRYLRVNNNVLQYSNRNETWATWNDWETIAENKTIEKNIYIVYGSSKTITTVDSVSKDIKITLTDYSMWADGEGNNQKHWAHNVIYNINDNHSFDFYTSGSTTTSPDYNKYTGGKKANQGFVSNNLNSGYPYVKAVNNTAGESLNYLFNTNGKTYYQANYLFKMLNGYYVYDSAENYAQFDTTSQNFTVYGQPNKGFFPFNKYTDNVQIEAASTDKNKVTNHHFGMHVNFTFMQPVNGTVNGEDMIFHFSGDDDVWVFIDGMLVLDLGGIHQPIGGTINFATGEVTFDEGTQGVETTSIRDMYAKALMEKDSTLRTLDDAKVKANEQFISYAKDGKTYYRYKNYSQHKLDFFYLERGAHDTNCNIKFNLISIPENTVSVEKEITETNMADFADATFKFKLETSNVDTTTGNYSTKSVLANAPYKLYEVNGDEKKFIANMWTDANGEFTLKHRQRAEFPQMPASTKYWVTELDVVSDEYDEVKFNGETTITNKENQEIGDGNFSTGELLAQNCVYVKFQNKCNAANRRNLVINKVMATDQTSAEYFNIKLEFADGTNWIPYVGTYYVGTTREEALAADPLTTSNGIVSLNAGQSAYILALISDTEYKVTEVLSAEQEQNFGAPLYSGTGREGSSTDPITGVIDIKDETTTVYTATVTNSLLMTVNVNKIWVDSEISHDAVYVGLYKQNGERWEPYAEESYRELKENAWSTSFTSLNGGVYDVKELVPVNDEGIAGDFVINGTSYVSTNDYYSNGSYDYSVSYSKVTNLNVTNVTITNTRLGEIVIEKVSKNDHSLKLEDAEFKLQKYDVTRNAYEDLVTGSTDENGILTFDNLEIGRYKVIEIKAPSGYVLSDEDVIVEIPAEKNAVISYAATIVIENEALYELPSTGGQGIYTTMLSGFALMLGAAYVWFSSRREESSNN